MDELLRKYRKNDGKLEFLRFKRKAFQLVLLPRAESLYVSACKRVDGESIEPPSELVDRFLAELLAGTRDEQLWRHLSPSGPLSSRLCAALASTTVLSSLDIDKWGWVGGWSQLAPTLAAAVACATLRHLMVRVPLASLSPDAHELAALASAAWRLELDVHFSTLIHAPFDREAHLTAVAQQLLPLPFRKLKMGCSVDDDDGGAAPLTWNTGGVVVATPSLTVLISCDGCFVATGAAISPAVKSVDLCLTGGWGVAPADYGHALNSVAERFPNAAMCVGHYSMVGRWSELRPHLADRTLRCISSVDLRFLFDWSIGAQNNVVTMLEDLPRVPVSISTDIDIHANFMPAAVQPHRFDAIGLFPMDQLDMWQPCFSYLTKLSVLVLEPDATRLLKLAAEDEFKVLEHFDVDLDDDWWNEISILEGRDDADVHDEEEECMKDFRGGHKFDRLMVALAHALPHMPTLAELKAPSTRDIDLDGQILFQSGASVGEELGRAVGQHPALTVADFWRAHWSPACCDAFLSSLIDAAADSAGNSKLSQVRLSHRQTLREREHRDEDHEWTRSAPLVAKVRSTRLAVIEIPEPDFARPNSQATRNWASLCDSAGQNRRSLERGRERCAAVVQLLLLSQDAGFFKTLPNVFVVSLAKRIHATRNDVGWVH